MNEEARRVLEQAGGRSLFLFLNYMEGHMPYIPGPGMLVGACEQAEFSHMVKLEGQLLRGEVTLDRDLRRDLECQYDGAIRTADAALEKLIRDLERTGRLDDAMIVITSDHGEAFGSKGYLFHSSSAYEDQVHVPLIVKYPNQSVGARVSEPTSVRNVFGIVLSALGIPGPASSGTPQLILAESFPLEGESGMSQKMWTGRAIYDGDWKLLVSPGGEFQLFDLSRDPNEERDLSGEYPDIVSAMAASLTVWSESIDIPKGGGERIVGGKLRALGYLR